MPKKKKTRFKAIISVAEPNDLHKGWIRVSENLRGEIPNATYVQVSANDKKVFCQVRGTQGRENRVEINEWYRNWLGWWGDEPPAEAQELEIQEVGFIGRIEALSSHPDDIVRVGLGS